MLVNNKILNGGNNRRSMPGSHQRKRRGEEQRDESTTRELECEKSALDGDRNKLSARSCQSLIGDSTHCMYILFYVMY